MYILIKQSPNTLLAVNYQIGLFVTASIQAYLVELSK